MSQNRRDLVRLADTIADPGIAEVYNSLLRQETPSKAALLAEGRAEAVVDHALRILHWREVIDASDVEAIGVAPPDIALPAYATALERQARVARQEATALAQIYHRTRTTLEGGTAAGLVRPLHTVEEITAVAQKIEETVQHSLIAMIAGGPRLELLVAGAHAPVEEVDHELAPIDRRVVVNTTAFDVDGAAADFMERATVGYDLRVAPNLPFNALIVDGESAIIDCTNTDPTGSGSLFIQDPTLVAALTDLVVRIHQAAAPLKAGPAAGYDSVLGRDRLILTLLASGTSDAVIARQAGVSRRTVERRIRALMNRLDAATRFQAGVRAARAGLI